MDTITTQEELEEILLDGSISYPRCFASLKEVFKDIQGSLLSLLPQYNILQVATGCYKYYGGARIRVRRGWTREEGVVPSRK